MWNENNSGFSTVFIRPLLGVWRCRSSEQQSRGGAWNYFCYYFIEFNWILESLGLINYVSHSFEMVRPFAEAELYFYPGGYHVALDGRCSCMGASHIETFKEGGYELAPRRLLRWKEPQSSDASYVNCSSITNIALITGSRWRFFSGRGKNGGGAKQFTQAHYHSKTFTICSSVILKMSLICW